MTASVAIVGPGALGGVLAAALARAGRDIVLCARRPVALEVDGEPVHADVWTDPSQARPVAHVLVTTKAYDSAATAPWLDQLGVGPVAIVQNGVEHRERFAAFVAAERLVPVVTDLSAHRDGDRIRSRGRGQLVIGDDAAGRDIAALFAGSGIEVSMTTDVRSAAWRKLCLNSVGAIPALTLRPARDTSEPLARAVVRECIAVGRAEGARLEDEIADEVIARLRRTPVDAINSLHADRMAGRPLEIDARNGAIVRIGARHGIATPYNHALVELLSAAGDSG